MIATKIAPALLTGMRQTRDFRDGPRVSAVHPPGHLEWVTGSRNGRYGSEIEDVNDLKANILYADLLTLVITRWKTR
jgi:hypothetical protein